MRLTEAHIRKSAEWTREIDARGGPSLRDQWVELDRLDGNPKPYRGPQELGDIITRTDAYREIATAPLGRLGVPILLDIGIDGYLHREEGLQLYELAYRAPGEILELGTHKGLSASIICRALNDRGAGKLETVDIDAASNEIARTNLKHCPGGERAIFTLKDATEHLDELARRACRYGFVFVDHWHGYEATVEAALRIQHLVEDGGHVMFHDFFDPANIDPEHVYGVYQGVLYGFDFEARLRFVGSAGGSAVFRRM